MELVDKAKNYVVEKVAEKVTEMEKPEAAIKNVGINHIRSDGIEYGAKVAVTNPYSCSIPICEIYFRLKCDGREVASGTIPDPGSLKANDTTIMDVPVTCPHSIMVSLLKDICRDWDIDYELNLKLIIDLPIIGNITIPVTQVGEIKLPTLKDLF